MVNIFQKPQTQAQRPVIQQADPMKQRMALALMRGQQPVRNWGDAASNLVRNMVAAKMMKEGGGPGGGNVKLPTGMMMGQDGKPTWIPGYLEGRRSVSRAGAPQMSTHIDTSGNYAKEYDKAGAKGNREWLQGFQDKTEGIQNISAKYEQLGNLLLNDETYTGLGAAPVDFLKRVGGDLFGLEMEGLGQSQMADKIADQMVGEWRKVVGDQRMSNADREVYRQMSPTKNDSKEAIAMQIEMMKNARGWQEKASAKVDQIIQNSPGGRLTDAGRREFRRWKEQPENRQFTPEMMERVRTVSKQKGKRVSPYAGMRMNQLKQVFEAHKSGAKTLSDEELKAAADRYDQLMGNQ